MDLEQKLTELKRRDRLAEEGGGAERRERQHKAGKMSARERIEFLLDDGTFEELDKKFKGRDGLALLSTDEQHSVLAWDGKKYVWRELGSVSP